MKQRILALFLCLALLTPLSPARAAGADTAAMEAEAAAVLSGLGLWDGSGSGHLTRAQFAKLAVLLSSRGEVPSSGRSPFSDVGASHWAAPYITLACDQGLLTGYGNGSFGPDDPVSAAQAVTALLRVLGYSTADIGPFWPEDYLSKAAKLGLTDGLTLADGAALTQGQGALLVYNALRCDTTEGKVFYTTWAASSVSGAVLMDVDAAADDGRTGTAQIYANGSIFWYDQSVGQSAALVGRRGILLLDGGGKAVGFVPDASVYQSLSLAKVAADGLTAAGGSVYAVSGGVSALSEGRAGTYSTLWFELENSASATVYYSASGNIDLVYFTDGGRYGGQLLTGYYENAAPNTSAPEKITLLGMTLEVADAAKASLSQFTVGQKLTVELDSTGKVAAAYTTSEKKGHNIGILTSADGTARVSLLCGLTATGTLASSAQSAEALIGGLVTVTSSGLGKLSVSALSGSSAPGKWDLSAGTVGRVRTAADLRVYDQVAGVAATEVDPASMVFDTVSPEDITYVGRNGAGEIDLIVLSNVTGDCYTYGFLTTGSESGGSGNFAYTNYTVAVTNSSGTGAPCLTGTQFRSGAAAGLAATSANRVAGLVYLTKITGVQRADFSGGEAVSARGTLFPISAGVEVYNRETETWTTLAQARAYGDSFSVYYDKPVTDGGQIRLIVVE